MHEYIVGIKELRNAIASFHERVDCVKGISADDIIVGPGTKQLSFLLFAVFDGGFMSLSFLSFFALVFASVLSTLHNSCTKILYRAIHEGSTYTPMGEWMNSRKGLLTSSYFKAKNRTLTRLTYAAVTHYVLIKPKSYENGLSEN